LGVEATAASASDRIAIRLPREFGWVGRMLPEAGKYAGALRYLLRDPEIAVLLEKAPQAGRMLRPLCRLLGVQTPEFLRRGAVVAREAPMPAAEEAPRVEAELGSAEPELANCVAADALMTSEEVAPAPSARQAAEEAARAYARRPGGLYWDGTRLRWS